MSERRPLRIAVAGPYTAATASERKVNLDKMNQAAARLLAAGHIPLIGVNAALPVVDQAGMPDPENDLPSPQRREAIMKMSMALIEACEAILIIGESPGANMERDRIASKGLPVYKSFAEIPPAR
ncbi:hypothetical protein RAS2_13380 [Phycisphaerae bacterium RAS2]|nr:hypothetical protein RAS2_13380 [Phycisphaerae bacterium RAS2]